MISFHVDTRSYLHQTVPAVWLPQASSQATVCAAVSQLCFWEGHFCWCQGGPAHQQDLIVQAEPVLWISGYKRGYCPHCSANEGERVWGPVHDSCGSVVAFRGAAHGRDAGFTTRPMLRIKDCKEKRGRHLIKYVKNTIVRGLAEPM